MNNPLRVKLHLMDVVDESFELPGFHYAPGKEDLIDVYDFVYQMDFPEEVITRIGELSWRVEFLNWSKDKDGFFLEVFCKGD